MTVIDFMHMHTKMKENHTSPLRGLRLVHSLYALCIWSYVMSHGSNIIKSYYIYFDSSVTNNLPRNVFWLTASSAADSERWPSALYPLHDWQLTTDLDSYFSFCHIRLTLVLNIPYLLHMLSSALSPWFRCLLLTCTSINKSPRVDDLRILNNVCFNFLSDPRHSMWTIHWSLRALIRFSRSNERVLFDVSSCCDLPVITYMY